MLDIEKVKNVTRPDFPKKCRVGKKCENVVKIIVFRDFLGNGSNYFDKKLQNGRGDQYEAFAKNRTFKKVSILEIFIHKVQIFAENGVQ